MKNIYLAIFIVAILVSCSKENIQNDNEIKLRGAISKINTKTEGSSVDNLTVSIAGWENTTSPDYTMAAKWQTNSIISTEAANTALTFAMPQYYNADNSIKSYVKAWYPQGVPSAGVINIANSLGDVDILYATEVSGSKLANITTPLIFNHLTTQLKFAIVAGTGLSVGTTLSSIKVKSVQIPTSLNLLTESLNGSTIADYMIQGISANTIGATTIAVGDPIMILPRKGVNLKLDVVTSTAVFTDVPVIIDVDTDLLPGKSYTITLTFKQSSIALTATVTPWTNGTATGEVE